MAGTDRSTASPSPTSSTPETTAAISGTPPPVIAESTLPTLKFISYTNDKYGYRIDYPEDFTLKVTNPFGAGISLASSDGKAELTVSGESNTGYRLQQLYDKTIGTSMAGEIGYHTIGQNWFVVTSTAPDGKIWYTKTYLGRAAINSFLLTFPSNEHAKYDPIVSGIEKSFRPGNLDSDH